MGSRTDGQVKELEVALETARADASAARAVTGTAAVSAGAAGGGRKGKWGKPADTKPGRNGARMVQPAEESAEVSVDESGGADVDVEKVRDLERQLGQRSREVRPLPRCTAPSPQPTEATSQTRRNAIMADEGPLCD